MAHTSTEERLIGIRERLGACPIPVAAVADWEGTNHYEIADLSRDAECYWWLDDVRQAAQAGSQTEEGRRLGAVLEYACHYRRDVEMLLTLMEEQKPCQQPEADQVGPQRSGNKHAMKTQHEILMEDPEYRRLYAIEGPVADAAEELARWMQIQGASKADLARRLGKSRAWVTHLLSGKANTTLRTLAEVMYALGARVELRIHALHGKMEDR